MSAPLTSANAQTQLPTPQTLQPTNLDQSRSVERQEISPQEYDIQAREAPSAQAQTSHESSDGALSFDRKEIVEFIMELKEMQKTGELPEKGAVLDLYT